MTYKCDLCDTQHETRDTLRFLYTRTKPLDPDNAVMQFNWVVCGIGCADELRNDPGTAEVLVDELFAG